MILGSHKFVTESSRSLVSKTKLSNARKILHLLTFAERRSALELLGPMSIGIWLKILGVGLVVPAITLLAQHDYASNYRALQPVIQTLNSPSQ